MSADRVQNNYTKRLTYGFVGSVISTLIVYVAVTNRMIDDATTLSAFVLLLAAVQALVQIKYFLHFDEERKPRWQLHSFWFTALMVLIVVVGSLWVMMNLNYNMGMSPEQMDQYMLKQGKKGF